MQTAQAAARNADAGVMRDICLIGDYLRDCRRRGLRPRTIANYEDRLRGLAKHAAPASILELDREALDAWLEGFTTAATRRAYRSAAVLFLRWCMSRGHCSSNAAELTARQRVPRGAPRPISDADLATALRAADSRMRVLLSLGAYAGLRISEMAALRVEHVRLDRGVIVVVDGKGGKTRTVPMHDDLRRAMMALPLPHAGHVVTSRRGDAMDGHGVGELITDHLESLGIDATPHQLRHWFGCALADAAVDIRTIRDLLGHASVATTEIYSAWSGAGTRAAVEALRSA